ncbi:MAG TPA: hypothetical protein PLA08_04005, partial [Candidatus Cloacimonadota bacterium]|nr:hypothetical protein [Candidatus Cloacimonadota bacterium]
SKNTFPPIVAPIYYEGMGLICITLPGLGLPGVNLIIYKDDLRMMASNAVAARDGAMKEKRVSFPCQLMLSQRAVNKPSYPHR